MPLWVLEIYYLHRAFINFPLRVCQLETNANAKYISLFLPAQNQLGQSAPIDAVDVGLDPTPSARVPRPEPLKSGDENAKGDEGHKMERYPLSSVDFARVKTPFIIGIWILSASIAKIGK